MRPLVRSMRPTTQNNVFLTGARCPSIQVSRYQEAVCVVPNILIVTKTRRRAHGDRLISERASAKNAKRTVAVRPRRPIVRRAVIGRVPAVLDPLRRIARGVVQAEGVWPKRAGGNSLTVLAPTAFRALSVSRTYVPSPPIGRRRSSSRRVFPLRLRGQSIGLPR